MVEADAVQLWEDTVGDSGESPTDAELLAFANAVEERARKPFVKLAGQWERTSKEYASYAKNNAGLPVIAEQYQEVSDRFGSFRQRLLNRIEGTD